MLISTVYSIIILAFRFLFISTFTNKRNKNCFYVSVKIYVILFKLSHLALLFQKEKIKLWKLLFQNYFVKMSLE